MGDTPFSRRLPSAASTSARLRKVPRSALPFSTSLALPLSAIARWTVGDAPAASTSRITRVEEGPTFGIFRRLPSGRTNDSIGAGSAAIASAARS